MIVESPAKAHTIGQLLGGGTIVRASYGHVRDLPEGGGLHVDLAHGFTPDYVLTPSGRKVIADLRKVAKDVADIYLATDPDREGEAISWHLSELLRGSTKASFHRISYHEITKSAIDSAFANPGEIDMKLVDAQQARRVLDRIVGFMVSPLACRNVAQKTSAGRVQSVALRLVVEREREIQAFKPEEYWNLDAFFTPSGAQCELKTRLSRIGGHKAEVRDAAGANALADAVEHADTAHRVLSVADKPRKQGAAPPFTTSTLQQAAGGSLHFSTTMTMRLAQELYEGVSEGGGTTGGLITYMRTDSVNVAKEAQDSARSYIASAYGPQYVPDKPNRYRSGKSAQEAHEAIRPTNVERTPESLAGILTPQQLKLYRLIWNRFVASQMTPAQQIDHSIEIESTGPALSPVATGWIFSEDGRRVIGKSDSPEGCVFRVAARETVFPGYQIVYSMKDLGQEDEMDNLTGRLPRLSAGVPCQLSRRPLTREQCFTQPPNRYSEAALVKAMESNGVGRPSTYAATVSAIQLKKYVEKKSSALYPTDLGMRLCDYLVAKFPELFNVGFTAKMEEQLDEIADGGINWVDMLGNFYHSFQQWLAGCGANPSVAPLPDDQAEKILSLFPEEFDFAPKGEDSRYDDASFVGRLRRQLAGGRGISERQSAALLHVAGKYAAQFPQLMAKAEELGVAQMLLQQQEHAAATARTSNAEEIPAEIAELIEKMKDTEWEKPATRGRRTYDDGKFFRSICTQAKRSGKLTPAQISALRKLAAKYAVAVPGMADSSSGGGADEGGAAAATPLSPEAKAAIETLFKFCEGITDWKAPAKRGSRTYDDRAFYTSLADQYRRRGILSDRQIAALQKMCTKYAGKDSPAPSAGAAIPPAARPAADEILDEKCPQCGAPLVRKAYRGRTFIGCTAYPACRYTRKDQPRQ